MFYAGKRSDTFAPAICQLLDFCGITPLSHVSCMSLRCFGFQCSGSVREWFRPLIALPDAVAALAAASGVPLFCSPWHVDCALPADVGGFVLGPLPQGISVPELQDHCYVGGGRFLSFRRRSPEQWEVWDPRGFSGLPMSLAQIRANIHPAGSWYIGVSPSPGNTRPESPETILAHGLRYHRQIHALEEESMEQACSTYCDGTGNRISLQYGVCSLLQFLDDVLELSAACGRCLDAPYLAEKQILYTCGKTGAAAEIPACLQRIWRLLDGSG